MPIRYYKTSVKLRFNVKYRAFHETNVNYLDDQKMISNIIKPMHETTTLFRVINLTSIRIKNPH